MATWVIYINEKDGVASFDPHTFGAKPGEPLQASDGDEVSWFNNTEREHQPWPADQNFNLIDDGPGLVPPIASNESSDGYSVAGTVYYVCRFHTDEHGTIEVQS